MLLTDYVFKKEHFGDHYCNIWNDIASYERLKSGDKTAQVPSESSHLAL